MKVIIEHNTTSKQFNLVCLKVWDSNNFGL